MVWPRIGRIDIAGKNCDSRVGNGPMMNYSNFTDVGLQMTSETQDWRDHARGLEDEMVLRWVGFVPVVVTEKAR
jgi:hypothetical protein